MSMSAQKGQMASHQRFSRQQMQQYFFPKPVSTGQITSQILSMHSIILPGSSLAATYHDDVYLKLGKDGQWRSSVNLYTFFFPTDRFIAMFTRSINALDRLMPADDTSEEYFYKDIVTAAFSVFQDTV